MILRHDGSFEGFLSAVFEAYALKLDTVSIRSGALCADLFETTREVRSDEAKAARVWHKLSALFGAKGRRYFLRAALYEEPARDDTLFRVIAYALAQAPRYVLSDYAHPDVLRLNQYVKSVNREAHRMQAFVRFVCAQDGLYCAAVEPDFNVLGLVAPFFRRRYADQRWLIADMRRGYALYYDLSDITLQPLAEDAAQMWREQVVDEEEAFFQSLWRDYFHASNIPERANRRLHVQHMPLRYWRYLTEKQIR